MPIYKFTSPEGIGYYGEGETPEEAWKTAEERSPHELAAMRTRRSVTERHEGPATEAFVASAPQTPEELIPGLVPAMEGRYGRAALDVGLAAALPASRFIPAPVKEAIGRGAGALGAGALGYGLTAPSNSPADESKFPFIDDPKERQAADIAYASIKEYAEDKKTGRKIFDKEKTAAAKNAFMAEQQRIAKGRAEEEAARTRDVETSRQFEESVGEQVGKLTEDQKAVYTALPNIKDKQDYLRDVATKREKEGLGFSQAYPEVMEALQAGSAIAGAYIPYSVLSRRALMLRKAADDAEAAFKKATKARAPKGAKAEMDFRANELEGLHGLSRLDWAELGLAPTIPYTTGTIAPNVIDMARLQNQPDSPGYKHAKEMLDPTAESFLPNLGRSVAEGVGATALGTVAGGARRNFPEAHSRATSTIRSIREQQEAERAAAIQRSKARAAATKRRADPMKRSDLDVLSPGYGDVLSS